MRHYYLILAHKNIEQVALLVNTLLASGRGSICFVHFDARLSFNPDIYRFKNLVPDKTCVILEERISVTWGGFSMVLATLNLIIKALNFGNGKFDYCSLISGQDFPIKKHSEIKRLLSNSHNSEFINCEAIPRKHNWQYHNGGLDRYLYYWITDEYCVVGKPADLQRKVETHEKKHLPYGIVKLFGGSQWWTLTYDCLDYIIDFVNSHSDYVDFYRSSLIPDESFFQTIVKNSIFSDRVAKNLRFIDWKTGPEYPRVLRENDIERIVQSPEIFARKFDIKKSGIVVEQILNFLNENITCQKR